jgi:hypothetical protein
MIVNAPHTFAFWAARSFISEMSNDCAVRIQQVSCAEGEIITSSPSKKE